MPISSAFSLRAALSFLPFGYLAATRLHGARDVAYLFATTYVPSLLIIHLFQGGPLLTTLTSLVLSQVAFLALYEIGYFLNDAWDARRDPNGRDRTPFAPRWLSSVVFVAFRVALFVWIALAMKWFTSPAFLAGYGALIAVFASHNLITAKGVRSVTFTQLACLRFILPPLPFMHSEAITSFAFMSLFAYVHLRHLAYLDSKAVLNLPERKGAAFALSVSALSLPIAAAGAVWAHDWRILAVQIYFVSLYAIATLLERTAQAPNRMF